MQKIIYSLLGLPASGKGTQADILSSKFGGVEVIGIGDLIRATIEKDPDDPFVKSIEQRYDKGVPQPDGIVIDLVERYLSVEHDKVIFDNFPFSIEQAKFMIEFANKSGSELRLIYIKISPDDAIRRIAQRKICADCGEIADGNDGMICDKCGGSLVVRSDDNEETVKKRIELYTPRIDEVTKFYRENNIQIIEIDGTKSVDEVSKEIDQNINE